MAFQQSAPFEPLEEAEYVLEHTDETIEPRETDPLVGASPTEAKPRSGMITLWRDFLSRPWFFRNCQKNDSSRQRRNRLVILALIPVMQFASTIALTTSIDVFRSVLCVLWFKMNDPEHIPVINGDILNDGKCDVPQVNEWFSATVLVSSIFRAMGAFAASTLVGHYAPKIGRKPLQMTVLILDTLTLPMIPLAIKVSFWFLPVSFIVNSLANSTTMHLLIYMSLTDLSTEVERTTYLLYGSGLTALGMAPSFAFGGLITSATRSPFTVYYIGATVLAVTTVVFALTVEETFGSDKRAERKRQLEAEREQAGVIPSQSHGRLRRAFKKFWRSIATPFHIMSILLPKRDPITGKRNYRLLIASASFFLGSFVGKYMQGILVYGTTKFNFAAKENGIMFSSITIMGVIWLLILSPILLKQMERFYRPKPFPINLDTTSDLEEMDEDRRIEYETQREEAQKSSMISRRDVHVVVFSYLLEGLTEILIGLSRTGMQLILSSLLLSCTGSSNPAIRSVAVASVPPLQSGEVLAAIEVIGAFAQLLSPIQGVLLTLLINTHPEIVFFLGGAICFSAAILMLFVRERDRYFPPPS